MRREGEERARRESEERERGAEIATRKSEEGVGRVCAEREGKSAETVRSEGRVKRE